MTRTAVVPARARRLVARSWPLLFGAWLIAAAATAPSRAWDLERIDAAAQRMGPRTAAAARALHPLVSVVGELAERERLQPVNEFYNRRLSFREDREVWNVPDHWASPLELLTRGAGDCEDYAIAKYFTLAAAGVPAGRMRLVYVRAQIGGPAGALQPHMVLAYYPAPSAEPLILDNLIIDVQPASRRGDLTPVFSFNSEGLWHGIGHAGAGDPVARLSRWREVLAKARDEGFP